MKRYDNLKQFMARAMHTLRVGGFDPELAFDVLRIGRRFIMPRIEFLMAAKRFDDPAGLNWWKKPPRIYYEPMRLAFETASSFYLAPEIADLKLDGKPLPDGFAITDRRVQAIFPRLESHASYLHSSIKRCQVTLQEALDVIGDRAAYELTFREYATFLRDLNNWDIDRLREVHKTCVDVAMYLGRSVPEMVLKDYPELGAEKERVPPKVAQMSLFSRPEHSVS